MDLFQQFFDKRFWYVLAGLLAAHLLAFAVQHTGWSVIPLSLAFLAALVLTMKRVEWGLAFAFLEVFIGGHGHLFDLSVVGFSVSVRIVIFGGVMLAWLILLLRRKITVQFVARRDVPWALFGLAILIGAVIGFSTNDFSSAFDDFNSYLSILYVLPMISVVWTPVSRRLLLLTLAVSAIWIAGSTLTLVFAFTHLPGLFLKTLYVFLRDARLAEITLLTVPSSLSSLFPSGAWYFRIFEQSQFLVVAFELLLVAATFMLYKAKEEKLPHALWVAHAFFIAAIMASFSRSFFLGIITALVGLLLVLLLDHVPARPIVKKSLCGVVSMMVALVTLWVLIVFPVPARPNFKESPFYSSNNDSRVTATTSRWNLLTPMMDKIKSAPLLGLGFGEEVTYTSDDPRIRATNSSGEYTTYRFEWGYQDLWLKIGILGLVAVFAYLIFIVQVTITSVKNGDESRWLSVGLACGIVALFVTHALSPYLNHPIGLGFMIFVLPFFSWDTKRPVPEKQPMLERAKDTLENLTTSAVPKIGIVTRESRN